MLSYITRYGDELEDESFVIEEIHHRGSLISDAAVVDLAMSAAKNG
jgi:ankyrin repeat protein